MSYVALYRKYRPKAFNEMVGQEHITKILKNQIITGKISHAYIFSGTRGTGKTSAAKIFARAINCLNPKDGEPCNECEACMSILNANTTDVVEMDAASNNSVENIRSIRQEVAYSTTGLKYKVYIIDEAHMLSTSAFNALLKTLEEPPENVVFILATTEEHKILPTILSRCIRFEFKKLSKEDIEKRIYKILLDLNIEGEDEAIKLIANLADGAMRDALSILERCISTDTSKITKEKIEEIIGVIPYELINNMAKAVLDYNMAEAEKMADSFISSGKDLRMISYNLLEKFLKVLVAKSSENYENVEEDLVESIKSTALTRIHEIVKGISRLDDALRQTSNPSILFKAKILELSTNVVVLDENELIAKIKELELKVERLEKLGTKQADPVKSKDKVKETPEQQKEIKENRSKLDKEKNEFGGIDKILKKVVEKDNLKLYSALTGAKAYVEDNTVIFTTENSFAYSVLNKEKTKEELKSVINEEMDNEFNIKIEYVKETPKEDTDKFADLVKDSGVPFEILD